MRYPNYFHQEGNEQRLANLVTLRDYIAFSYQDEVSNKHFDMSFVAVNKNGVGVTPAEVEECGTCMCVMGHAPLALGEGSHREVNDCLYSAEEWHQYCDINFIHDIDYYDNCTEYRHRHNLWSFLFSSDWKSDIQQAIKRMNLVINGDFDVDEWGKDWFETDFDLVFE